MKNLHSLRDLHIHFVGIGGISMSGLAKLAINQGCKVSGSDLTINHEIDLLQDLGVDITIPHSTDCITQEIDLIVYTAAIPDNNVELEKGRSLGIQLTSYDTSPLENSSSPSP